MIDHPDQLFDKFDLSKTIVFDEVHQKFNKFKVFNNKNEIHFVNSKLTKTN